MKWYVLLLKDNLSTMLTLLFCDISHIFSLLVLPFFHQVVSELVDENLKGERDGNEVPLGKMIKRFKSQGAKAKKVKKNQSSPVEAGNTENDVDILKMVRQINFDNMGKPSKFESSNGHEHFPSKKSMADPEHEKGEKRKASDQTSVPVPKRRRSLSTHSASRGPSNTSKTLLRDTEDDLHQVRINPFLSIYIRPEIFMISEGKLSVQRKLVGSTKTDLLASCFRKNMASSSKHKGKGSDRSRDDMEEASDHEVSSSNNLLHMSAPNILLAISCNIHFTSLAEVSWPD